MECFKIKEIMLLLIILAVGCAGSDSSVKVGENTTPYNPTINPYQYPNLMPYTQSSLYQQQNTMTKEQLEAIEGIAKQVARSKTSGVEVGLLWGLINFDVRVTDPMAKTIGDIGGPLAGAYAFNQTGGQISPFPSMYYPLGTTGLPLWNSGVPIQQGTPQWLMGASLLYNVWNQQQMQQQYMQMLQTQQMYQNQMMANQPLQNQLLLRVMSGM